jgi:hypothetical protein
MNIVTFESRYIQPIVEIRATASNTFLEIDFKKLPGLSMSEMVLGAFEGTSVMQLPTGLYDGINAKNLPDVSSYRP